VTQPPGLAAPAGWYPDPSVLDQLRYWDGSAWSVHTSPKPVPRFPLGNVTWQPPTQDATFVRQMSGYSRWTGVAWIVLGGLQILSLFGIVAGAWNVFAGVRRIRFAERIKERAPSVPQAVEGLAGYVIIGVVNLLLGGVIGIVLVGVDLFVRDRLLQRRALFEQSGTEPSPGKPIGHQTRRSGL
jgi:hypothetical protein